MKSIAMLRNGLALGAVVLVTACDDADVPLPGPLCVEAPMNKTQNLDGPTGSGGTNGLNAKAFHQYFEAFLGATKVALGEPNVMPKEGEPYPVNQKIKDGLLKDGEDMAIRTAILEHAIQCAVPKGKSVIVGENLREGGGLLKTTAGWLDGPLDPNATEDLFTCMAIMLNPFRTGVPVFLSGPSVNRSEQSTPPYELVEGLWMVDLDSGRPVYHIWPLLEGPVPEEACYDPENLGNSWGLRLCGTTEVECGLDVREDLGECVEVEPIEDGEPLQMDGGHFTCLFGGRQRPAIRTMLRNFCDVSSLFCPIPQ